MQNICPQCNRRRALKCEILGYENNYSKGKTRSPKTTTINYIKATVLDKCKHCGYRSQPYEVGAADEFSWDEAENQTFFIEQAWASNYSDSFPDEDSWLSSLPPWASCLVIIVINILALWLFFKVLVMAL